LIQFLKVLGLKFGAIEGATLYHLNHMEPLLFDDIINVYIVDSGVDFTFHEFTPIILFNVSLPLFPGHGDFLGESLLPKKSKCHIISISDNIIEFPLLNIS
jgi:hypothetical protein